MSGRSRFKVQIGIDEQSRDLIALGFSEHDRDKRGMCRDGAWEVEIEEQVAPPRVEAPQEPAQRSQSLTQGLHGWSTTPFVTKASV